LSILDFFREEKEYVVWVEIASGLARFAQVFSGEPWYEKFVGLKRDTFSTLAESLGWSPKKDEHFTVSMLRDLALFQAGSSGNEKINIEAKNQFEKYLSSGQPPHKDIRSAVYLLVARSGLKDTYAKFLNLYKNAHLSDERERLGEALGYFSNRSLLTKTLNFCLTDDVRPQDFFSIFRSVARNINGRDLIWAFVKKNWPRLLKIYGSGGHAISKVIEPLGMLADDRSAREIKAFFKKQKPIGVERTVSQVLEMIVAKSAWRKREGKKLARWFQNL
jgi:aminopeptidase N